MGKEGLPMGKIKTRDAVKGTVKSIDLVPVWNGVLVLYHGALTSAVILKQVLSRNMQFAPRKGFLGFRNVGNGKTMAMNRSLVTLSFSIGQTADKMVMQTIPELWNAPKTVEFTLSRVTLVTLADKTVILLDTMRF